MKNKIYDERHGGSFDRGAADSWYRRPKNPHFYIGATMATEAITFEKMSDEQIAEYNAGYDENETNCDHKDWG